MQPATNYQIVHFHVEHDMDDLARSKLSPIDRVYHVTWNKTYNKTSIMSPPFGPEKWS